MIRRFFCYVFFLAFNCQAVELVCRTYDVGHGNFSIVSYGSNHLIIDCGAENPSDWVELNSRLIESDLQGASSVKIIITHDHEDHYNLLKYLRFPDNVSILKYSELYNVSQNIFEIKTELNNFLENCLGDAVTVKPIVPNEKINTTDPNTINLILMIEYAQRKILFTGDANKTLLYYLRWNRE